MRHKLWHSLADVKRGRVTAASCAESAAGRVQTWKRICEASRNEFNAIYERLGVRLTWRGESFYNPQLRPLVEELQERGVAEESQGALVTSPAPAFCPDLVYCGMQQDHQLVVALPGRARALWGLPCSTTGCACPWYQSAIDRISARPCLLQDAAG